MILSINHWKEYVHKTGLKKSGIYISCYKHRHGEGRQ